MTAGAMNLEVPIPKKTIDVDIRERIEAACRSIMADHPEVEAIGVMFLSKQLMNVLSGMIVGADGPRLRPDQNVRLFEVWVKVGMQLMTNHQFDIQVLEQILSQYARRLADAKAESGDLPLQQATRPSENET
jgi:hypothetical protein